MSDLSISQLFIYPLKSAAGISVSRMTFDQRGPTMDRRFMLVDESNRFLTQRQHAKMCLLNTQLTDSHLTLSAPNQESISIPWPAEGSGAPTKSVRVWKDEVQAIDCGVETSEWLTQFFGFPSHLVFMPDSTRRLVDQQIAKQGEIVGFADAFPILLCNEGSLEDFNKKLNTPISMNRFRPNIVIKGAEPWAEDHWSEIAIGSSRFTLASACSRCIVPSIDQATGQKQAEVIEALNRFRRIGTASYFGQNLIHQSHNPIRVGDPVDVIKAP